MTPGATLDVTVKAALGEKMVHRVVRLIPLHMAEPWFDDGEHVPYRGNPLG